MESWRAPQATLDAFLAARHGDPFALLGPHAAPGGTVVRAFVPHAEFLDAVIGDRRVALARRHDSGFFEGLLEGAAPPLSYRLAARNAGGAWELEDPYRFGPTLGPLDDHLLVEGTHRRLHERLGAHAVTHEGVAGVRFAVWAPNAARVSLVAGFNDWDVRRHPMRKRLDSGLWEIFIPGIGAGQPYKFAILARDGTEQPWKADPFGLAAELRPSTASLVAEEARFAWSDSDFLAARAARQASDAPISIYEVHAPSWRRHPDGRFYDWDELAASLVPYAADLGFTHLELLPVMEHPLDESWGYQPIGMFAPTARLGDARGLMRFVDAAHRAGLGVILDWVPAHFPRDPHGLIRFDGEPLYEHPDPRRGSHREWGTAVFDYGRREVAAFLASSALHWIERFHVDGLRVDAVSSMVWLDHGRQPGDWAPNPDGSTENHEAIAFLRGVNALVAEEHPGIAMIAEEATSWPGVTRPSDEGGLGFRFKWNMGWMNDTLRYVALDPVHRRWHHALVTFGLMYAHTEDFVLPLSHDEVVHGKGSLLGRLPQGRSADDWERFATLRAYYAFMWGHPGKKLLFMGGEIAQWREWSEARELDWHLLQWTPHQGVQRLVRDLNAAYRAHRALHRRDREPEGFRWIDPDDAEHSTFTWLRFGADGDPAVAVLCNFTPVPRAEHIVGLPSPGRWREVLNTDAAAYGGSGMGNLGVVEAVDVPHGGFPASARVVLPPLATIWLVQEGDDAGQDG
ncbi:1,4-alpha-glucan branching protein GlgB [Falsiroseomonas oryziterrae]|uniref:1,4-alpha-glucan branching protein GlgB n=1 Tax=Falsiroseomonas oryziterrae TaxID=2911368 RepID=UPI001F0166D2|nr:1,4-alpha-glucan branching protein GlgB [Roseomonas sp. NPKOSM-4]